MNARDFGDARPTTDLARVFAAPALLAALTLFGLVSGVAARAPGTHGRGARSRFHSPSSPGADDDRNLYFSTWTSGVLEPLVDSKPSNCVAKIEKGERTAEAAFTFAYVADPREGAAVRNCRDGRMLFSVFHDERADFDAPDSDPAELLGERNWRTWLYDPDSESAEPVDSLDWNSGATYVDHIGDAHYVMVPSTDYASTTVVALDEDLRAAERFELRGWGTRLFEVK